MGVESTVVKAVATLRRAGHLGQELPLVVEIGAQQMAGRLLRRRQVIADCCAAFGKDPADFGDSTAGRIVHGELEELAGDAPPASLLWRWLGFDYAALDIDGSDEAMPVDLNYDDAPPSLKGRAALVTNCGTTEHVANQLNAFKIIHDLAAVGGIMLHHVPAQGFVDHGLITYSPKFFWHLARSNGYQWLDADFRMADVGYTTPQSVIGEIGRFRADAGKRLAGYEFADTGLLIVLRKVYDIAFVPPIDVPNGAHTGHDAVRRRYWTVFEEERFQAMIARGEFGS